VKALHEESHKAILSSKRGGAPYQKRKCLHFPSNRQSLLKFILGGIYEKIVVYSDFSDLRRCIHYIGSR
jgi:hypothetical protein